MSAAPLAPVAAPRPLPSGVADAVRAAVALLPPDALRHPGSRTFRATVLTACPDARQLSRRRLAYLIAATVAERVAADE